MDGFCAQKNGPHLSCDLHKLGVNLYSKLPAIFLMQKEGRWKDEWMDGRKDGRKDGKAGLRIVYINQKFLRVSKVTLRNA